MSTLVNKVMWMIAMPPSPTLDNITISHEDVLHVLKLINASKASGPASVHATLLKEGAQTLSKYLSKLICPFPPRTFPVNEH